MKELSLNILDVAQNSINAGATLIEIIINEQSGKLTVTIKDNGCGIPEDALQKVTDPFYTTRTTRKVGLGLPLFKMAAEQTGGDMSILSTAIQKDPLNHGTAVTAHFFTDHIDSTPLGDIISSIITLIQGHPDTDIYFKHTALENEVLLDTRKLREILDGVPLNSYRLLKWIEKYLNEQYLRSGLPLVKLQEGRNI